MIECMVDLHQRLDKKPLLLRSASIFSGIVSLIGDGSNAQGQALIKALQDAQLLKIEIKPIGSYNGYSKLIAWQMTIAADLAKNLYLDGNREGLEERENSLI